MVAQEIVANKLSGVMANLWKSGESSNLTVICGIEAFNVHSFLVCPNSKFFAAACNSGFKETTTKRIELPDDNPTTVRRMLQFCYGILYSDTDDLDDDPDFISGPHAHAEMYALAEKYEMEDLKRIAGMQFTSAMNFWRDENHNATVPLFSTLVSSVYKGTPGSDRLLRDALVNYAQRMWNLLAVIPDVKEALADNLDFAFDMINDKHQVPQASIAPPHGPYARRCWECFAVNKCQFGHSRCIRCRREELGQTMT